MRPVRNWDEAYLLSLPKEDNEFERKGARKLDLTLGADENDVLNELAKQLSAFAHSGGGKIIYGLKDDGTVDGGISTVMKKGGTKEWLERQSAALTEYEIVGANVFEIESSIANSQIDIGKAVYVIDVPDSDRAPHQSRRDLRYYVRLGSQSLPASHRMIEDIRSRLRHPRLDFSEISLEGVEYRAGQNYVYDVRFTLRLVLFNSGPLKSTDTFVRLKPTVGEFNRQSSLEIMTIVFGTKSEVYQWSLNRPLPPESEVVLQVACTLKTTREEGGSGIVWMGASRKPIDEMAIDWIIYADSAPLKKGTLLMGRFSLNKLLNDKLNRPIRGT